MANEITLVSNMTLKKGYINKSYALSTRHTMTGEKGPTPGAIEVPLTGVQISFSELTTPGWCFLQNIGRVSGDDSDGDLIEIGIRDPGIDVFYPLLALEPGMGYPIYFTPNLLEEYAGTGTDSTAPNNYLWLKATGAAQIVLVEAYEK